MCTGTVSVQTKVWVRVLPFTPTLVFGFEVVLDSHLFTGVPITTSGFRTVVLLEAWTSDFPRGTEGLPPQRSRMRDSVPLSRGFFFRPYGHENPVTLRTTGNPVSQTDTSDVFLEVGDTKRLITGGTGFEVLDPYPMGRNVFPKTSTLI